MLDHSEVATSAPPAKPDNLTAPVQTWTPAPLRETPAKRLRHTRTRAHELEDAALQRRVDEIGSKLKADPEGPSEGSY